MESTRNEILILHKKKFVYINAHCGQKEVKLCFGGGLKETTHSLRAYHFCFDEINVWADVRFQMI